MQKILIPLLAFCLLLLTGIANAAENPLYQVEIVVFKHVSASALNSEVWPLTSDVPSLQNTINLAPTDPNTPAEPYQQLPSSDFVLNKEVKMLNNRANYQVVLHKAWLQPIGSPRHAKSIHIFGGQAYDSQGNAVTPSINSDTNSVVYGDLASTWQIDGTIRVSQLRYFDAQVNLILNIPAGNLLDEVNSNFTLPSTGLDSFHLLQAQKMRKNELHYIDHPLFGVLVKIIPYQKNMS